MSNDILSVILFLVNHVVIGTKFYPLTSGQYQVVIGKHFNDEMDLGELKNSKF